MDVSTAGVYTVTYSASDAAGNTGTATRTVTVSGRHDGAGDAYNVLKLGVSYTKQGRG